MASKILEYVEAITQHRDTALLDRSIVASLAELLSAYRIALFTIAPGKTGFRVAITAWTENGDVNFQPDIADEDFRPVEHYAGLNAALQTRQTIHEHRPNQCAQYWEPIFLDGTPVACLMIESDAPLSSERSKMVGGLLALYRNYLSLLEDSQKDTLTGLSNRKTFERSVSRLLAHPLDEADPHPLGTERRQEDANENWLAVVDIDHFKRINDQFGHLFGDEVLIVLANLMRHSFRQQDRLFRFGGEEFVILLRNVTSANAHQTIERFRQYVQDHPFPGNIGEITVSVGFSRIRLFDTPLSVLGQADDALYYAKEHGRNQVHCYEDLVQQGLLQEKAMNSSVEMF